MNEENDRISFVLGRQAARLIGKLLEMASDEFANHGCNDFDLIEAMNGNQPAARHLAIGYHAHNLNKMRATLTIGDDGDVSEADLMNIPDFGIFSYIGSRFKKIAEIAPREEKDA